MSDFKKSLLAGIAAAQQAESNKDEILQVIADLNYQVEQVSDSKAKFGIATLYREANPLELAARTVTDMLSRNIPNKISYAALVILNYKGSNGIEIAKWEQGANGYPCIIIYNAQKFVCSNKTELESSLSELMKGGWVGKAILKQINFHDKDIDKDNESD